MEKLADLSLFETVANNSFGADGINVFNAPEDSHESKKYIEKYAQVLQDTIKAAVQCRGSELIYQNKRAKYNGAKSECTVVGKECYEKVFQIFKRANPDAIIEKEGKMELASENLNDVGKAIDRMMETIDDAEETLKKIISGQMDDEVKKRYWQKIKKSLQ